MRSALGLVPAAIVLSWAWELRRRREWGVSWRDALLASAALGAGWVVLGTELLGALGALAGGPILGWWVLGWVGAWWLSRQRRRDETSPPTVAPGSETAPVAPRGERVEAVVLAGAIAFLMAWAAAQALLAPPNNADVQAYHLPRQVYWLQQGSLAHYPTSVLRQLAMPPFGELVGANLLALSGGDLWHNVIQWTALGLLALLVSALVGRDGGGRLPQLWAALATVAIPSGFAEASNAKNDVLVALWLGLFAYWSLFPPEWFERLSPAIRGGLSGLALGALLLTKGTGLVFAAPLVAMLAWAGRRRDRLRPLLVTALVAIALNLPHWARNTVSFGSPLGPGAAAHGEELLNELHTPSALVSNLVRTLAPHLATASPAWNAGLDRAIALVHVGLGLSPDDPRTTHRDPPYQRIELVQFSEDTATAPGHVYLLLLLVIPGLRRRGGAVSGRLLGVAAAGFVLFCAALKWQLWHPRLLTPLVALCVPALARTWGAGRLRRLLGAGLLAAFLAPTLNTLQRPLLGPRSLFSASRASALLYALPGQAGQFVEVARVAHGRQPRVVGFQTGWSGREYAFQWLITRVVEPPPGFTSFNATFVPEGRLEPAPDLVISQTSPPALTRHAASGRLYAPFAQAGAFTLLEPWSLDAALAAADIVVLGRLVSLAPLDAGHVTGPIAVEEVLRGPERETLPLVAGDAAGTAPIRPVAFDPGSRGVWLLHAVGTAGYVARTAADLRPVQELETIRERSRSAARR